MTIKIYIHSIFILLGTIFCIPTQSMETIDKPAPYRSYKKGQIKTAKNKYNNNVVKTLNRAATSYSEFVPQKRRIAPISNLIHGDIEPVDQVKFDEFWHELNNQTHAETPVIEITTETELNNPSTTLPVAPTIANTETEAATRKPRTHRPEYEFIQRYIEEKPINITCCSQQYSDFKTLRSHVYQKHESLDGYSAHLKDGSTKVYAQQELAACKMVYERDPLFFSCPKCIGSYLANTVCLKRHYEKCLVKNSTF